jgi:hypothetical protein
MTREEALRLLCGPWAAPTLSERHPGERCLNCATPLPTDGTWYFFGDSRWFCSFACAMGFGPTPSIGTPLIHYRQREDA